MSEPVRHAVRSDDYGGPGRAAYDVCGEVSMRERSFLTRLAPAAALGIVSSVALAACSNGSPTPTLAVAGSSNSPGATFGPQPNADFSNCGASSESSSGTVAASSGVSTGSGFAGVGSGTVATSGTTGLPPGLPSPTQPVFGASVTATV